MIKEQNTLAKQKKIYDKKMEELLKRNDRIIKERNQFEHHLIKANNTIALYREFFKEREYLSSPKDREFIHSLSNIKEDNGV